jgi:hypothetical protein
VEGEEPAYVLSRGGIREDIMLFSTFFSLFPFFWEKIMKTQNVLEGDDSPGLGYLNHPLDSYREASGLVRRAWQERGVGNMRL